MKLSQSSPTAEDPPVLKPIEPACPQCGYDLRGLATIAGARCPECGAKLSFEKLKFKHDRKEMRRYRRPGMLPLYRPMPWALVQIGVVTLYIGTIFVTLRLIGRTQMPILFWLIMIPLALYFAGNVLSEMRRKWRKQMYGNQSLRQIDGDKKQSRN